VGIIVGRLFRNKQTTRKNIDRLVSVAIYALLFLLGISVGINDKIIADFSNIGYNAFVLTLGAVLGSLILAKIVYSLFFKFDNTRFFHCRANWWYIQVFSRMAVE